MLTCVGYSPTTTSHHPKDNEFVPNDSAQIRPRTVKTSQPTIPVAPVQYTTLLELKRPKMIPESILYPYYRVGVNFLGENTGKRPFLGSSQH